MNNYWEDLRKQARQYENKINQKLVALSKLGLLVSPSTNPDDLEPLISGQQAFKAAVNELEQHFSTLNAIIDKLGDVLIANNGHTTGVMVHTLQRHREMFQDYALEFRKIQRQLRARREREDLLQSVRHVIDAYKISSGCSRKYEMQSRENHHLSQALGAVDIQMNTASELRYTLASQTVGFRQLQTRLRAVSGRFPVINSLLQKVDLRRRRDSLLLALVISLCTLLMMAYVLT